MSYTADSCFIKGADHSVCQDYTSHGFIFNDPNKPYKPYIILCDGCSSAKNSDFGARLLSRACEIAITDLVAGMSASDIDILNLEPLIRSNVSSILKALAYEVEPVLATVMLAFVVDGITFVYSRGDGTIHIKTKDGVEQTTHVSYVTSAPFYLAYDLLANGKDQYLSQFNSNRIVTTHIDGVLHSTIEESPTSVIAFYENDVDAIVLSSDGMDSFRKTRNSLISTNDLAIQADRMTILSRAKAFKNKSPGFVQRRVSKMEAENIKLGIEHYDDFSLAAIVKVPNA